MTVRSLVNGQEGTSIGIDDRGLHYGDGLFETMAVAGGSIRRLDTHLARLERGCARLGFASPPPAMLREELERLSRQADQGIVKLIITRGASARGYAAAAGAPTRVATWHPWPAHVGPWREQGIAVRLCEIRLSDQPVLAGLKHCNRLEQVLARREWDEARIAEGLLLDARGALVCGTMTNVFVVRHGTLLTPRVDRCGVAGTVRETILSAAPAAGIAATEDALRPADLETADEAFVTNAILGVCPVTSLCGRSEGELRWPVGPVTRRLQGLIG